MDETDLKSFSKWKHLKSGDYYTVLWITTRTTNGQEGVRSVVYRKRGTLSPLFDREVTEFLDGRFVKET